MSKNQNKMVTKSISRNHVCAGWHARGLKVSKQETTFKDQYLVMKWDDFEPTFGFPSYLLNWIGIKIEL